MPSPFPGMDPYIESQGLWEDFHHRLVPEISKSLQDRLPDRYIPRLGERLYVEMVPEGRSFAAKPDMAVAEDSTGWTPDSAGVAASSGAVALADPVILPAAIDQEFRDIFLEIRDAETGRVVTVLELLSPPEKRSGANGRELYLRKRQAYREGRLNLVEIDLLRGGHRPPMGMPWPPSDYYILVARGGRWHRCEVWPFNLRDRVPSAPIPLLPPDPDVVIDLQPLIHQVYADGRYERTIDYAQPLRPGVPGVVAEWIKQIVSAPPVEVVKPTQSR